MTVIALVLLGLGIAAVITAGRWLGLDSWRWRP